MYFADCLHSSNNAIRIIPLNLTRGQETQQQVFSRIAIFSRTFLESARVTNLNCEEILKIKEADKFPLPKNQTDSIELISCLKLLDLIYFNLKKIVSIHQYQHRLDEENISAPDKVAFLQFKQYYSGYKNFECQNLEINFS